MKFSFESFVDGSFDRVDEEHATLWLKSADADIGGGKISKSDIDVLTAYENVDTVSVSGLNQDTFEYFISKYGKQLKAVRFIKNKTVNDISVLGTLPQLEYVYFFGNQRIDRLWNMSGNTKLTGLCLHDFSRLHSIEGVETAPSLKEFEIGNAVWDKAVIESLMPLARTGVKRLCFSGKSVKDDDYSFLETMPNLKSFEFALDFLTTEQVAWMVANFPKLNGRSLRAKEDTDLYIDDSCNTVPGTFIVGKRKPSLVYKGNEAKIAKYVMAFENLKCKYKGLAYAEAFKK